MRFLRASICAAVFFFARFFPPFLALLLLSLLALGLLVRFAVRFFAMVAFPFQPDIAPVFSS